MTVYLVYTGADLESYMEPVELANSYGAGSPIPTLGWATIAQPGAGALHDWHPCRDFGGVQIVMKGCVVIGVSAGELREVEGRAGDAFVIIDHAGKGHWAQRRGEEAFKAINIRLSGDWEALKGGFETWPDKALPYGNDAS